MVCWPTMSPASLVWLRFRALWSLWVLLVVLLAPWSTWATMDFQLCGWKVVLSKFKSVGDPNVQDHFMDQKPVDTVSQVFKTLGDSPIDLPEKYLGFPYYLKINYSCVGQNSEDLVRSGHLMGLKPMVLVNFQYPVNFYRWKIEKLQILMEAAPLPNKGPCEAAVVCSMSWYTPMPIKNGSVVMRVDISGNGLGPFIPPKRFYVNVNGFLKKEWSGKISFTIGEELPKQRTWSFPTSKPLWYTKNHTPVLILGGIENEKMVLVTDTNFQDYSLVGLSIDSCWVDTFCPFTTFSSTIQDTISTESTLFIRQNQLVYYFTGRYTTLFSSNQGSNSWVRVLASECIKQLCPVFVNGDGSEYMLALSTGRHEGYVHMGTITDGRVSFKMYPENWSVCEKLQIESCSIIWATYVSDEHTLLLLVSGNNANLTFYTVVSYDTDSQTLNTLYTMPKFIPNARGLNFLMILGTEVFTSTPMTPKGMFYNTFNNLLYIWGNFILESYNGEHFLYLADFPKESVIEYMVNSYEGDMAIVTETDEIWYFLEGGYNVYKLYPSKGWQTHLSLQMMQQSLLYSNNETMVTLFYEDGQLYQLVHLTDANKNTRLVKRPVPVEKLLMYEQQDYFIKKGEDNTLSFRNLCPFSLMRLRDLPESQTFTRQERYEIRPPQITHALGFHSEESLAIYQGLIYNLLQLHSKYDKPYADPVHDPTWRWWKNMEQDRSYYSYLMSNFLNKGNVYIDLRSYVKIHNLGVKSNTLPEIIFMDKGAIYNFSVFLTSSHGSSFEMPLDIGSTFQVHSKLAVGVTVADPGCIETTVKQSVLVNRKSVLYQLTFKDKMSCYDQGISGHNLKKTSIMVKVLGSSGKCFQNTHLGSRMQGNLMVPVLIGCPPGKRLAFDITYTIKVHKQHNKHYFDCLVPDPEMPCFLFRDIFTPYFLIQDLVTGHSGIFMGRYIFKVVGGGHTMDSIRDYTEEEIFRYNSPLDKSNSLIWKTKMEMTTSDLKFHILSYHSSGIEWLCLENSPCHDILPRSILSPEFFLKVLVSNRGIDGSTYCDYKLIFLLHLHGLPISGKRSLFIVIVATSVLVGLVLCYILFCLLWPLMVKAWYSLRWKINNIIAAESYYTYATSTAVFSMVSPTDSQESNLGKDATEEKTEAELAEIAQRA